MEHGTTVKLPEANRKYKDTIFRWLFSDRENLLSLYNAVTGKNYTDAKALDVVTLESAVYLGMKNDVAFLVDTRLYLCEHQSTYNPNIPLRNLFYIASEYQVLVKDRSLYSSVLIKLPAPKFLVFYNGPGQVADREELRLSAAYENLQGEPELELKVTGAEIRGADGVERGGRAGNYRMHPGGDSVGFPVPKPSGGVEGEHI